MSITLPTANAVELHSTKPHEVVESVKKPKLLAIPSTTGTGLSGEYFSDSQFTTGYELRTDAMVKLTPSGKKDPATTVSNSIRWSGQVSPTYSEAYSFSVIANGGVRLWVNGQLLINQAVSSGGNYASAVKINLTAGQRYSITLEYTRRSAVGASVALNWSSLHQKLGVIPQKALFPDSSATLPAVSAGLIGQYYVGQNFNQLVMERVDPGINFNFGSKSPTFLIPNGSSFSIRWTGQIIPTYSETYTFTTTSDDGVRLYVNDELLIDNWTNHTATNNSAQITLVAGKAYDIRMDYYQYQVVAVAELKWSSASQPEEVVPASALTSTPVATAGTLTALSDSSSTIQLSWTGSPSAVGYLVEQSTDGGTTYSTIASTPAGVTDYEVKGLSAATTYTFRVAPVGSIDTSTPSNAIQAATETAIPSGVSANPTSSTTATLNWSDTPGETGFAVYEAPVVTSSGLSTDGVATGGDFVQIGTVAAGVTTFNVTGLSPATPYQFAVRSINSAGVLSGMSQVATATTPTDAPPGTPVANASTNSIVISWNDVTGEAGFAVDRSLDGVDGWTQIGTTEAGVLSYTDTTIQSGITYYYRIRSLDSGGTSVPTSVIAAVTTISSPLNLVPVSTTTTATVLNWSDVAGEDGFAVLESTDGGNTFSKIGITAAGVTTYPVTGLAAGATYQFAVEAFNSVPAASTPGNVVSVTTIPAAPASVLATPLSASSASLTWNDVAGETGFTLQRSPDGAGGWSTIATLPAATLAYTDTTLSPGTSYFYRVSAINSGGTSAASTPASVLTIPSAPVASLTGLSVSQSQVSWGAVTGATQYIVQRSLDGSTNWTTAATATGSLSATVSNLASSTKYYYRVAAVNASGSSSQSATVSQVSAPLAQYSQHNAIYGTTSSGAIYAVDLTAGTSTFIGQLSVVPAAPGRDPISGILYFYQQGTSNVYSWNPTTGNTQLVETGLLTSPSQAGAYRADGTAFVICQDGYLRSVPSGSSTATTIGKVTVSGMALPALPGSMAFSSNGTLYMMAGGIMYTLNTTTAAATPIASTLIGNVVMAFGPRGLLYTTDPNGNLYSLNLSNALASLVGNDGLPSFNGLAAVPVFTDLSVTASATPTTFTTGQNATYTVHVTNTNGDATSQPITVTTTLPAGLSYTSISGTGWTASASGQTVVLTYSAGILAGGTLPAVSMTVAVSNSAPSLVTTAFTVSSTELDANLTPLPATVASVVA
jgi:uncharacterized repeat protein (TIGR01451 family)